MSTSQQPAEVLHNRHLAARKRNIQATSGYTHQKGNAKTVQEGRWPVAAMTNFKRWLVPSLSIGVLLFFVGIAVGQRIQSSRFDPYLASTPKTMELAVLAANVGVVQGLLSDQVYSTGIEVPTITYDAKAKKLRGRAVVNRNLVQQPVEKVKELLLL